MILTNNRQIESQYKVVLGFWFISCIIKINLLAKLRKIIDIFLEYFKNIIEV